MRWLALRRNRRGRERGAVAVLVTVVISGMLLALGAFITDVGSWYAERAQLQSGADAAALAVAQTCIAGNCDANLTGSHPAPIYANANANDNLTSVDYICGNGPGLSPCTSTRCPAGSGNYVTVHTKTLENGGSHLLPPIMGDLLLGSSYDGETIDACATATWSAVGGGFGTAMTLSLCAWRHATGNGTLFALPPPYPIWPPLGVLPYVGLYPLGTSVLGGEQVLAFHGTGTDCAGAPSGWQLPGGFGYLQENGYETCTANVRSDLTYIDTPGNSITAACATQLTASATNHTVVFLPVYDGFQASGANGMYHLAGFAAFVLTGGWLDGQGGGFKHASTISGLNYCRGDQRCLYGFFTQGLVPRSTVASGGGGSLPGAYVARITA